MNSRPEFSAELSKEEFLKHYWYKAELQKICSDYHLPTLGTKAELQNYILSYLEGNIPKSIRKIGNRKRMKTTEKPKPITLETKLIEDGFKFDNQARSFFANYYHVSKFSFTKTMATALRIAEERNDKDMTVKDLIDVYENKTDASLLKKEEEATYQWNNFLRDFYSDKHTKDYKKKHQIASFLWRHVRDTPGEKKYTSDLLEKYGIEISKMIRE